METNLEKIITEILKSRNWKCMFKFPRHVILSDKSKRDAPQHRQGLGSTICRYLPLFAASIPLFAANPSAIRRYLALVIPLFVAIC